MAKLQAFELAAKDFINRKKSILLYLGKFPGFGFDIDGGSILAKQLIDSLKIRSNLSVCFIRKNNETFFDEEVCEVKYLEYKDPWNNKFIRRLENLDTNYEALRGYENYDLIIAAHISKFFGMNNVGNDFWKKTIIFPMFCTSSYVRVGEHVPPDYTLQERVVVENVSKIITPSEDEKNDLIADYKCDESKIFVIRRGISPYIHYCERSLKVKNNSINLVCIGTIKLQKNTKATLKLIKLLRQKNIECKLNLVATIQDRQYYDEFRDLVHAEMLSEYVKYHISVTQKDLANLLEEMDINVSMSSWETFGRGIFEGADLWIAYNNPFDLSFLRFWGIDPTGKKQVDVMREFAPVYGEWNEEKGSYKWQKLAKAAAYYGYSFSAHDSLEDVKATLFVYQKMKE